MKRISLAILLILMLAGPLALQYESVEARGASPSPTPKLTPKTTPKPTPRATPGSNSSGGTSRPGSSPGGTRLATDATSLSLAEHLFQWPPMIFLLIIGAVGFGIGALVGNSLGDATGDLLLRGMEAAILAVLGGFFARLFIALLLWAANDSPYAHIAVGWGFFLVPGLVDTFALLIKQEVLTSMDFLLWMATIIGAFTGMMNGIWRIHDWKGLGYVAFPLDVTWGLAGATTGSLSHIINIILRPFGVAEHADETRHEAHRYIGGMRIKGTFAFTQGAVMSNLSDGPGTGLYYHERTHVWQNRGFGPLFTLTYLGWMAAWVIPGAIAAIATRDVEAIQSFCYYNNPWETWAYLVGAGPRTGRHPLIWGDVVILILSIAFFGAVIPFFIWVIVQVW